MDMLTLQVENFGMDGSEEERSPWGETESQWCFKAATAPTDSIGRLWEN